MVIWGTKTMTGNKKHVMIKELVKPLCERTDGGLI